MWLTCTNKSYDFAYTRKRTASRAGSTISPTPSTAARTSWRPTSSLRTASSSRPTAKHAVQQTFFLYVYEPGGNRVEVANAGARLVLAPDWKPITWTEEERKKAKPGG